MVSHIGIICSRGLPESWVMQSKIGNGVRNWITGDQITDTGCSLKLVRREAIDRVRLFTGMILKDAILNLESLDQDGTIFATEPWTENSLVVIEREPETGLTATQAVKRGLKYFLEVSIAQEFLQGWKESLGAEPSLKQQCARLIQYAKTDA